MHSRTNATGKGARALCHGIIKAAKVAVVAHGAKAAVRAVAHGAMVVADNPQRMLTH